MFKTIKQGVSLEEVISHYTGEELKQIGESVTLDSDTCPFCGHKECFRIKPDGEDSFYHCFSCDEHGDAITFVQVLKSIEKPAEACRLIAKDFNITLPTANPLQEIFDLAARYYQSCFDSTNKPYPELNGLTPREYQNKIRGHKDSTLESFQVGWSDGSLIDYLKGIGTDEEMLANSGLVNKIGKDFLPAKTFIYPHLVKGRVSHFTFKDPLKKLAYQLKSANKLNGHQWYNQDAAKGSKEVILVEGENDLLSIIDAGATNVLGSIGSLAGSQVDWLINNLFGIHIITMFDPDSAGDKYREKIDKVKSKFASVRHFKPDEDKDIDDLLRAGVDLGFIISSLGSATTTTPAPSPVDSSSSSEEDVVEDKIKPDDSGIFVKENCYFKVKYKEGEPVITKLSNFTICLKNVFIKGMERTRDVVLIRQDGKKSKPVPVTSETKTSVKSFRTFAANVIDGSFYGTDSDLTSVWEHVYMSSKENEVHLIDFVGRNQHGWLFGKKMITLTSKVLTADDNGTFWQNGKPSEGSVGIKAISINSEKSFEESHNEVPELVTSLSVEENQALFDGFVTNLAENLGCIGSAITAIAWLRANVYCTWFVKKYGHFPYLYLHGDANGGKSTIISWLLSVMDMNKCGLFKMPNIRSQVAVERKVAYYSSLPICIDEMRADKQANEYQGMFRAWYDRVGREMGTNADTTSVRSLPVRACVLFAGQDVPTDSALKQRFVPLRIVSNNNNNPHVKVKREMVKTYKWIESRKDNLSSIGYHWILEHNSVDQEKLYDKLEEMADRLKTLGVNNRFSINFALITLMGEDIVDRLFPDFDWEGYMVETCKKVQVEACEDDLATQFFMVTETLTTGNNPRVTGEHYKVDGSMLYLWIHAIWQEVSKEMNNSRVMSESFTKGALINHLKEQGCYVDKARKYLGIDPQQRTVIVIDLEKAPEYITNFAKYSPREITDESSNTKSSKTPDLG